MDTKCLIEKDAILDCCCFWHLHGLTPHSLRLSGNCMADIHSLLPEMSKHENRVIVREKGKGSVFFFFCQLESNLYWVMPIQPDLLVLKEVRKRRQSDGGLRVALRVIFHPIILPPRTQLLAI